MEATVNVSAMTNEIDGNKENQPPKEEKSKKMMMMKKKKKKKNPIPLMGPSFKKKSSRKTSKRVPLSDITHLFRNSAPLMTSAHEGNGASSSDSVVLNSNTRRRTMKVVVAPASKTKTLRMGFR